MTSIKDPIRQASLFTSWGLIDPRLMPDYVEPREKPKETDFQMSWWAWMISPFGMIKELI